VTVIPTAKKISYRQQYRFRRRHSESRHPATAFLAHAELKIYRTFWPTSPKVSKTIGDLWLWRQTISSTYPACSCRHYKEIGLNDATAGQGLL
jgi:hypothetical protein